MGPVVFPFIVILLTQIASKSASKTVKKDTKSLKREAICYATVVHGAENDARHWRHRAQSELLFFLSSVLLPQRTEGAGINHPDNCALHNAQRLLENQGFLNQTGENWTGCVIQEAGKTRGYLHHVWHIFEGRLCRSHCFRINP